MKWYIGTSGWSYDQWKVGFYPEGLPAKERLRYYSTRFDAVEINNSFYHLPSHERLLDWQRTVPEHFTFALKASRYITHNKKLKDADRTVANLMKPVKGVEKIGPLLFQLPPRFGRNEERLEAFLKVLPKNHRCAMEFRDPSWYDEPVYALLRKHKVAFCLFEKGELHSPRLTTADFTYVRLHGRKEGYRGNYTDAMLRNWHQWLKEQRQDCYIFFDNTEEKLYAVENALTFKEIATG